MGAEEGHLIVALPLDLHHGPLQFFLGCHIMAGGVDGHVVNVPLRDAGNGVDLADPVHLVPEKLHPDGTSRPVGGIDFQRVPPEAELVPGKVQVVSLIADFRQLFQHIVQRVLLSHPQGNDHALIVDGVAQTVQAADRGNHDHVPPLKQRRGRRVTEAVDLFIHGGVLFNVGVCVGDVGFGLIIIVVGNEVFHRVFREKLPEFRAELGSQRLLCASTRVGRFSFSMTEAMVKVLPEPVTPSSVCSRSPQSTPLTNALMASG